MPALLSAAHLTMLATNTHSLLTVDTPLNDVHDLSIRSITASSGVLRRVLSLRLCPLRAQHSLYNLRSTAFSVGWCDRGRLFISRIGLHLNHFINIRFKLLFSSIYIPLVLCSTSFPATLPFYPRAIRSDDISESILTRPVSWFEATAHNMHSRPCRR